MNHRIDWGTGDEPTPPPPVTPAAQRQPKRRRRGPWKIRVAGQPLPKWDGARVLSWTVSDDRLICICPTTTDAEKSEAIAECVRSILLNSPTDTFNLWPEGGPGAP